MAKNILKIYPLTILAGVGIFFLCAFPGDQFPDFQSLNKWSADKVFHGLMFFSLTHLWIIERKKAHSKKYFKLGLIFFVLYGCLLEIGQTYFFIHRYGEWVDVIANSAGIFARAALGENKLTEL